MKKRLYCLVFCLAVVSSALLPAQAASINVAVASNFINPAKQLATQFSDVSGHSVNLSSGSTGKLYTQIINGAPFDIFLAANAREPQRLEQQGQAVTATRVTYAIGRLVLWSADPQRVKADCATALKQTDFRKLAIANPRVAPYGKQAEHALITLGVYETVQPKLIMGENIGEAFRFVSSGNAELGIISLSQVKDPRNPFSGSHCVLAETLHQPLLQQTVMLQRARGNQAAREFIQFLQSAPARALIENYGYDLP